MNTPSVQPERSPATLSILGFGACLVTGYPLPEGCGFLQMAVEGTRLELDTEIDLEVVSITACTAPKAMTRLAEDVLLRRPDIVVLQFGQSDVKVAIRRLWREVLGQQRPTRQPVLVSEKPLSFRNRTDSFVRACAGLAIGANPFSSRSEYRQSIASMVETLVAAGIYPIVFTPFVLDNFLSDAWARCYSRDIVDDFQGRDDVCVINGWEPLSHYPRRKTLLHDGIHLSRLAHQVIAERLKPELVGCIRRLSSREQRATNA